MSALSRIRDNIGLVAIIIFIALIAFILTDLISGINTIFGGVPSAGTVAGETIDWQEYQNRIGQQGPVGDEANRTAVANQVWTQMVDEKIFDGEYDNIGLEVTGDEIYDMFVRPVPHPLVQQYFLQNQEVSVDQIKQALDSYNSTEEGTAQFSQFEDFLAQSRARDRYLNMIQKAWISSPGQARQTFINQNRTADVSFLGVNYTAIPDSTIEVSDSDLRSYISDHADQFEQEEQTFIRYITYDVNPSTADTAKALNALTKQRATFASAPNDSIYTRIKSSQPYVPGSFINIARVNEELRDSIVNGSAGDVFGPVQENNLFKLYKLVDIDDNEESWVKINHILITPEGTTAEDTAAARSSAASLARQANSSNFADLASENSDDFASKENGGSLGWIQRGQFGEDFDEAMDNASVGRIIGPVKGRGGFHVVQILDKTSQVYDLAQIEEQIIATSDTRRAISGEANKAAAQLRASGNINAVAEEVGKVAFASPGLTPEATSLPGVNGGRDAIIWALNAEVDETSPVFSVNNNKLVVAQVSRKLEEGLQSIDEQTVRENVERLVREERKAEIIQERLAAVASGDLNAMRDAYNAAHGTGAYINTATAISFSTASVPGIGPDGFIIGKISGMQQGEVTDPLIGLNGVYVVQATAVTEAQEADALTINSNMAQQVNTGGTALRSKIYPALREVANIEDNRAEVEALLSGR